MRLEMDGAIFSRADSVSGWGTRVDMGQHQPLLRMSITRK